MSLNIQAFFIGEHVTEKKKFGFFSLTCTPIKNKYYVFFGFKLIKLNKLVFLKF